MKFDENVAVYTEENTLDTKGFYKALKPFNAAIEILRTELRK